MSEKFSYIENQLKSSIEKNASLHKVLADLVETDIETGKKFVIHMCEIQKANNESLKLLKELYIDIQKLNASNETKISGDVANMTSIMKMIDSSNSA